MYIRISSDCLNCGHCASRCPVKAIHKGGDTYVVDESLCIACETCIMVCPVGAPQLSSQD